MLPSFRAGFLISFGSCFDLFSKVCTELVDDNAFVNGTHKNIFNPFEL